MKDKDTEIRKHAWDLMKITKSGTDEWILEAFTAKLELVYTLGVIDGTYDAREAALKIIREA